MANGKGPHRNIDRKDATTLTERRPETAWEGSVESRQGTISVESSVLNAPYSFGFCFKAGAGTNPEESQRPRHRGLEEAGR